MMSLFFQWIKSFLQSEVRGHIFLICCVSVFFYLEQLSVTDENMTTLVNLYGEANQLNDMKTDYREIFKINFLKKIFQKPYQSVKRLDTDQDGHFVQTVCKGYQQTIKVTASKERVNSNLIS